MTAHDCRCGSCTSSYRFLSSYRGRSDYRRRADGVRYTVHHAAPAVLFNDGGWTERPDLADEWHAHRVEQARHLATYCTDRNIPADLRGHFPDVTDAELAEVAR